MNQTILRRLATLGQAFPRALLVGLLGVALLSACSDSPEQLVAMAKKEIEKNDLKAAAINLRTALQKDSNNKEARYVLGTVLRQTGELASAEKELRRALELGYDKDLTTALLAQTVFAQGKLEEFSKEFGSVELASPDANADLKALIGSVLLAKGQVDEAAKAIDAALALKPASVGARVGKARIAATRRDLEGAERMVAEVLKDAPKDREALNFKATLAAAKGDRAGVMAIHKLLAEYYPNGVSEQYTYAVALLEHNQVDEATKVGNHLAKLAPRDPRALHLQALNAFQRKDYSVAQDLAVKALTRAPSFIPAHLVAGASMVQLKSYQQAIQHLSTVTKAQRANPYARQLLIAAYIGTGDSERAQKELKDALELIPNDPKLLLMAGEISIRLNDATQATKYFELSAEKGGNTGLATLRLGQAHIAAGHEDEGLRILEDASKSEDKNTQSDLALVAHHLKRNQLDKALSWISSIEKKQPDRPIAPSLRGIVLALKKDLPGARKQFETALQRDPANVMSLEYLSRMDEMDKKPEDTKVRYEEALKKSPRNEIVATAYARTLLRRGEKAEAVVGPLRTVIKNDPTSARARLALIDLLLRANEPKQALSAAQEAVAALPNQSSIRMALGRAQQASGDVNQAVSTYTEAAKFEPKNPQLLMSLADVQAAAGNHRAALDTLKKLQDIKPDSLPVLQALVITHVRLKDPDPALKLARDIRQKYPKQTAGLELEAAVLVTMNQWGEAADVLEQAYKQDQTPGIFMKLYGATNKSGRKDRAATLLSSWFAKNPKDVSVRIFLAEAATMEKNLESATKYYKEAAALQPKNPALLNNLAFVAGQLKDPQALSYAEEANTLAPNSPAIMDTLGWMLVEKGDTQRGVDLLQKASKGAPDANQIRFNLARALIKAGRKEEAKRELEFLAGKGEKFKQQAEVDQLLKQL